MSGRSVAQVTVGADTIVPASCQCIVGGRADVNDFRSRYGVVGSIPGKTGDSLLIGNTMVDPYRGDIPLPVRLTNTSAEDIFLKGGTPVACPQGVEDFLCLVSSKAPDEVESVNKVTSTATKSTSGV